MFCCTTLEEVQLVIRDDMISKAIIPISIDLPFLRKLTLGSNIRLRPEFMQKLLHGCPLLEELKLVCCFLYEMEIYSPLLKSLIIIDCDGFSMFISCPGLLHLDLELYSREIRFTNLTSLENAFIHFPVSGMDCYEILSSLSNATTMKLFGKQFQTIFKKDLAKCSTFKNLRELVLDECLKSRNFDIMACFRRCSPNLGKSCFRDIEEERPMEKAIDAPEHDGDAYNDDNDDIYSNDDGDQDEDEEYVD
ncbi:putative F-box/FBD/LRR-repeat protein [Carex littledalei]|uniref:Putative F-box/FBD/LRR-repeat protein n=1 Tax=Carex littledalei TaxID=544730 RepID=A0A833VBL1_9POAL|nr:putative F-box/FBD/LRR-repeat protein [Carex littledalei]